MDLLISLLLVFFKYILLIWNLGIQIGALGAIAPSRTKDLAQLAFSAMLTGTFFIL